MRGVRPRQERDQGLEEQSLCDVVRLVAMIVRQLQALAWLHESKRPTLCHYQTYKEKQVRLSPERWDMAVAAWWKEGHVKVGCRRCRRQRRNFGTWAESDRDHIVLFALVMQQVHPPGAPTQDLNWSFKLLWPFTGLPSGSSQSLVLCCRPPHA